MGVPRIHFHSGLVLGNVNTQLSRTNITVVSLDLNFLSGTKRRILTPQARGYDDNGPRHCYEEDPPGGVEAQ